MRVVVGKLVGMINEGTACYAEMSSRKFSFSVIVVDETNQARLSKRYRTHTPTVHSTSSSRWPDLFSSTCAIE